jgi:hypothetical protein
MTHTLAERFFNLDLWLAGAGHFVILIASFQVPSRLRWKQDLAKLMLKSQAIVGAKQFHGSYDYCLRRADIEPAPGDASRRALRYGNRWFHRDVLDGTHSRRRILLLAYRLA